MYPNHQHPRHSDFPITVTQAPHPATFAWNYGGIQGISAQNFDEQHSYLVQLSIFNYDCFNTGSQTGGGTGIGNTGGGEPTGQGTGQPNNPGGGPPVTSIPPPTNPPWPGHGHPGTPEIVPGHGGRGSRPPTQPLGRIPGPPGEPNTWTPGGYVPPGQPGTSGEPSGQQPFWNVNVNIYPEPNEPVEPTVLGTQVEITNPVNTEPNYTLGSIEFERPSENTPGGTTNPNLVFTSVGRSPAIPGEPSTNIGLDQPNGEVNANTVNAPNEGSIPGMLSTKIVGDKFTNNNQTNQVNTSNLEHNALMDVLVANDTVTRGEPIVISCVFTPPVAMQAMAEVTIQDGNLNIPVVSTDVLMATPESPLTCGISTTSSQYSLGEVVVTCTVRDATGQVIGIKSVLVAIIEEVNDGTFQSSKVTISEDLPSIICNHGGMANSPINLDLSNGGVKYVIMSSEQSVSNISSALQTDDRSQTSYSLAIYTPTGSDTDFFDNGTISGEFIQAQSSAYTDSRYDINGEEVYPNTHAAGLSKADIPSSTNIAVEIAPMGNSSATRGHLYMSEEMSLRSISGTATASSLTVYLPFGAEDYGLVIHGKISGAVPTGYAERKKSTNNIGVAVWDNITLTEGDMYSVVPSVGGRINPFSPPVYTGIYTT